MQSLWILCTAKPPEGQEVVIGIAMYHIVDMPDECFAAISEVKMILTC
jgi:hypothetical protein